MVVVGLSQGRARVPLAWGSNLRLPWIAVGLSLGLARVPLDWSSNLKLPLVVVGLNLDPVWALPRWGPMWLLWCLGDI